MGASFFALTSFPLIDPFIHPMNAAWAGLLLAHFWTVASYSASPLRDATQIAGGIDDAVWDDLRRWWGWCLAGASQLVMAVGLVEAWRWDTPMFAPILAVGASVLVHHGVLKNSLSLYVLAGIESLVALHADFLLHSYFGQGFCDRCPAGVVGRSGHRRGRREEDSGQASWSDPRSASCPGVRACRTAPPSMVVWRTLGSCGDDHSGRRGALAAGCCKSDCNRFAGVRCRHSRPMAPLLLEHSGRRSGRGGSSTGMADPAGHGVDAAPRVARRSV